MTKDKLRIGIIGVGSISHCHIHGYRQLDNVELVAACDINTERAERVAKQYGIPHVYTDFSRMLEEIELDGVSVCTWNNIHAQASIAALEAGVNVLCEKPLAINAKEAEVMVKTARKTGKLLMVGFVRRFAENTQFLKSVIEQGELGHIYYGKTGCIRRCGNPGGWFSDKKRSGGGPLIDLGVHIIDLVRFLMGKPKAISVVGSTFYHIGSRSHIKGIDWYKSADYSQYNDVEDGAAAMIKFDNGSTIFVETSWVQNIKEDRLYLELYGSKAGAVLEPQLEIIGEKDGYLVDWIPKIDLAKSDFQHNFDRETAHFIDCIANGIPCLSPGEDGLEIMKILDAVYESADTGKEVAIE